MSAKAKDFDPDKREQNKSVVQRFITPAVPPPAQSAEPPPVTAAVPAPAAAAKPEYILVNAMEEAVWEEVRATMNRAGVCKCEQCYYAVCAAVLNNMLPRYATSREDALINKAKILLNVDALSKLSSEIFGAIEKIKKNPVH